MVFFNSFFLTPNYDDGQGAYWISNTIDFENPFFSDYFKTKFVVEKIPTLIMALGFTYLFPFSFVFPAALYGILCLLCSYLSYKVARFYSDSKTALLCSQLFLYSLLTHNWICPTRSELWLLSVIMAMIYLFELYHKDNQIKYLILISLFVGILGLPLHSNALILYVYLIGHIVIYRNLFSLKSRIVYASALAITSIIGIVIVLFPDPVESIAFLKNMSMESGNRFIPNIINPSRFLFIITLPYYKYLIVFFTLLSGVWLIENRKEFYQSIPHIINGYKNVIIYFIAAVLSIEILPAGKWTVYFVYYYFPFFLVISKIFFFKISGKGQIVILISLIILLMRFTIVHISLSDILDHSSIIKLFIFYIPIILLIIFYKKIRLILLYGVLYLGLTLNIFYQYHNWLVYHEVRTIYERNPDVPIISIAEFNWINRSNTNYGFAPYKRNLENSDLSSGLLIFGETNASRAFPVASFREFCIDCNFENIEDISSSWSPFVDSKFRRLKVYKYSGFEVDKSPFN